MSLTPDPENSSQKPSEDQEQDERRAHLVKTCIEYERGYETLEGVSPPLQLWNEHCLPLIEEVRAEDFERLKQVASPFIVYENRASAAIEYVHGEVYRLCVDAQVFTQHWKAVIEEFPSVANLCLLNAGDRHIQALAEQGALQTIAVIDVTQGGNVKGEGIRALIGGAPHLRSLRIGSNQFDVVLDSDDLKYIPQIETLQVLDISRSLVTAEDLTRYTKLLDLRKLYLSHCPNVGDEAVEVLGGIPSISELHMASCPLSGKSYTTLAALPNLKELIDLPWVDEDATRSLLEAPSLERLIFHPRGHMSLPLYEAFFMKGTSVEGNKLSDEAAKENYPELQCGRPASFDEAGLAKVLGVVQDPDEEIDDDMEVFPGQAAARSIDTMYLSDKERFCTDFVDICEYDSQGVINRLSSEHSGLMARAISFCNSSDIDLNGLDVEVQLGARYRNQDGEFIEGVLFQLKDEDGSSVLPTDDGLVTLREGEAFIRVFTFGRENQEWEYSFHVSRTAAKEIFDDFDASLPNPSIMDGSSKLVLDEIRYHLELSGNLEEEDDIIQISRDSSIDNPELQKVDAHNYLITLLSGEILKVAAWYVDDGTLRVQHEDES